MGLTGRSFFPPCLDLFIRVPKTKKVNLSLYSPSGVLYVCICNMHPLPPWIWRKKNAPYLRLEGKNVCYSRQSKNFGRVHLWVSSWHGIRWMKISHYAVTQIVYLQKLWIWLPHNSHICPLYHSFFHRVYHFLTHLESLLDKCPFHSLKDYLVSLYLYEMTALSLLCR